jgi:hypothetical protein
MFGGQDDWPIHWQMLQSLNLNLAEVKAQEQAVDWQQ